MTAYHSVSHPHHSCSHIYAHNKIKKKNSLDWQALCASFSVSYPPRDTIVSIAYTYMLTWPVSLPSHSMKPSAQVRTLAGVRLLPLAKMVLASLNNFCCTGRLEECCFTHASRHLLLSLCRIMAKSMQCYFFVLGCFQVCLWMFFCRTICCTKLPH